MKNPSLKEIGNRIRLTREKANITQHDLYEKTGISTTQISAYENGKKNIGLHSLAKIANSLNVTIDYIYYGPVERKSISSAKNTGELVVNCISALFDEGVIQTIPHKKANNFVCESVKFDYRIGFGKYINELDDLIIKLQDYEKNKANYPDPKSFKEQLLASTTKQINNIINNPNHLDAIKLK